MQSLLHNHKLRELGRGWSRGSSQSEGHSMQTAQKTKRGSRRPRTLTRFQKLSCLLGLSLPRTSADKVSTSHTCSRTQSRRWRRRGPAEERLMSHKRPQLYLQHIPLYPKYTHWCEFKAEDPNGERFIPCN